MFFADEKGLLSFRMPQEIVCKKFETVADLRCRLQEKLALRPSEARFECGGNHPMQLLKPHLRRLFDG